MDIIKKIAQELSVKPPQVDAAVRLIDEGNTIPLFHVTAKRQRAL